MGGADSILEAAEARPDVIDQSRLDPHVRSLRSHAARGTLINSSYAPLHVFGIVSIVTLICCLTASIVLLPALILQSERWSQSAP